MASHAAGAAPESTAADESIDTMPVDDDESQLAHRCAACGLAYVAPAGRGALPGEEGHRQERAQAARTQRRGALAKACG